MQFEKATDHPMKSARILVHTGVGLRLYRHDRPTDTYLTQDVRVIGEKYSKAGRKGYAQVVELFPEQHLCEHDALASMMRKIRRALTENQVLSIVTHNTWLAQTIVDQLVRRGLSPFLHVLFWADERLSVVPICDRSRDVLHGWFPDQATPVATKAFELAPRKLDYLDNIDFTQALYAALDHS